MRRGYRKVFRKRLLRLPLRERYRLRRIFSVIIFIALLVLGMYFTEVQLIPLIKIQAKNKLRQRILTVMNETIQNQIIPELQYDELVEVKFDNEGRAVFLHTRMDAINHLKSLATLEVQRGISELATEKLQISLGQVSGSKIMSQIGPRLSLQIRPQGTVIGEVREKFDAVGINQSRHQLSIHLQAQVYVIMPFLEEPTEIATEIPLTESLIIGEVPAVFPSGLPLK